jgi:hypothetical protein
MQRWGCCQQLSDQSRRDCGEKLRLAAKTAVHSLAETLAPSTLDYSKNEITMGYFKGDLLNELYA